MGQFKLLLTKKMQIRFNLKKLFEVNICFKNVFFETVDLKKWSIIKLNKLIKNKVFTST